MHGDTAAYVEVVAKANFDRIPADARSLRDWIGKARVTLANDTHS
jgi:hypothetical protein